MTRDAGIVEVTVAPITHAEPKPPSEGVEIPAKVKRHLGLDGRRSWAIVTDLNVFIWPGVDLHAQPNHPPGTFAYGTLPPALFEIIRKRVEAWFAAGRATPRTE